jgi:hypothetical protein
MAKSALQRKQDQIARERERLRTALDSTYPFLHEPFYQWLERTHGGGEWETAMWHFDASALPQPEFTDDSGPRSIDGEVELMKSDDYDPYAGYERSIGRMECLIDNMLASALLLTHIVNDYKSGELRARIVEIEQSDLSDPEKKRKALADIVRLQKMLDQLSKEVRRTFPQWKVKGV